jgi:hypothetical protein
MAKQPSNSDQSAETTQTTRETPDAGQLEQLAELIRQLSTAGGVPITLSQALPPKVDTAARLNTKPPVSVAFPPCSDELLSLIKTTGVPQQSKDDITRDFDEYFKFGKHHIIEESSIPGGKLTDHIDSALLNCMGDIIIIEANKPESRSHNQISWPSDCCLCSPCVFLYGNRNPPPLPLTTIPQLRRLFIGDLCWLFYYDRMGIFQILGVILDAFASNGRIPISNGSLELGIKDDIIAIVLEVMVRQTKIGLSSTVRDRSSTYRTSLGWVLEAGRKLNLDTEVNTGFSSLLHKFIFNALEFYKDKRLAVAIRGSAAPVAPPSVATLITISDTIDILKKRFESFDYGRNYTNTLSGIVWLLAAMSVIRDLRTTLGIPPAFSDPHEFIPAAYDLLVLKRTVTHGETNRYIVHRELARNGRDILLDMEVINHLDRDPGGELENWLTQIEAKVEAYRTAYRTLTGVDLGISGTPNIEQQV